MALELRDEALVDEPLVVAEVEVGLAAVVGDEHLAVLERVHRARVDVDVRVELLQRDPQATELEQPAERRGGEALAERAGNPTGHENVLRHRQLLRLDITTESHPTPHVGHTSVGIAVDVAPTAPVRAAGRTGSRSRQHSGDLGDPFVALDRRRRTRRGAPLHVLSTTYWVDAERRDLGEVGHHEHLRVVAEAGQRRAHRGRRRAADARIDLVEHERQPWRRAATLRGAEGEPQRQHRSRQLAARRHPRQRQQG